MTRYHITDVNPAIAGKLKTRLAWRFNVNEEHLSITEYSPNQVCSIVLDIDYFPLADSMRCYCDGFAWAMQQYCNRDEA